MNNKAFLAFALVIAFTAIQFAFVFELSNNINDLMNTKNSLIQAEKANLKRTILETNFDFIINKTLENEINNKNFNPEIISLKILEQINKVKKFHSENEFTGTPIVKTLIIRQNRIVFASANITSGVTLTNGLKTTIKKGNAYSEFIIPNGYSSGGIFLD